MPVEELKKVVARYAPDADVDLIQRAFEFAERAHQGQYRDSGDSFIFHPLGVAEILAELELDVHTIAAGLLHDVIEDTEATYEDVEKEFGAEIADLVEGVTKLGRLPSMTQEQRQAENLRKMFLAMARDIRVILIRLADRLHNMRTLKGLAPDRRKKFASETVEIYAPLAHRLGMWRIKWELEDLAFRYLEPEEYYKLVERVARKRQEREGYIEETKAVLRAKLAEAGIERAEIQGRAKHFYSIYEKMRMRGKAFDEIYDLIAVRIIVDTVKDCYTALGVVHTLWKPIPGRFKDYVAMPKSNMYQSLHTTVIDSAGEPLEIQIRTWDMHRTAEYGIAAHWRYKEGTRSSEEFEEKISWLRQLLEWQKDLRDVEEFMEALKIDLFGDEVFVFTPKGDVKSLPAGSTPVDFAYAVHSDIGNRCSGAKVNGRIVPLDYVLKNGDQVEILVAKAQGVGPSRDWLSFVKTSKAKGKIRQWLKEQRRDETVQRGRDLIERELKRLSIEGRDYLRDDRLDEVARRFGFVAGDDLLEAVGYGRYSAAQVLTRLLPEQVLELHRERLGLGLPPQGVAVPGGFVAPAFQQPASAQAQGAAGPPRATPVALRRTGQVVRVRGVDNLLVRLSRCCSPVPGDRIVGYVTRGRGISVHRADCPNVRFIADLPERSMDVEWSPDKAAPFPVELEVSAADRVALLAEVMNAVTETRTNISAVNARTTRDRLAVISLTVEIDTVDRMNEIMRKIRRVEGVIDVHRASHA